MTCPRTSSTVPAKDIKSFECWTLSDRMDNETEEMSAIQPKRLISKTNHGLVKSLLWHAFNSWKRLHVDGKVASSRCFL